MKVYENKEKNKKYFSYLVTRKVSSHKIGFCIGEFFTSQLQDRDGLFYFALQKKVLKDVDSNLVSLAICREVKFSTISQISDYSII